MKYIINGCLELTTYPNNVTTIIITIRFSLMFLRKRSYKVICKIEHLQLKKMLAFSKKLISKSFNSR